MTTIQDAQSRLVELRTLYEEVLAEANSETDIDAEEREILESVAGMLASIEARVSQEAADPGIATTEAPMPEPVPGPSIAPVPYPDVSISPTGPMPTSFPTGMGDSDTAPADGPSGGPDGAPLGAPPGEVCEEDTDPELAKAAWLEKDDEYRAHLRVYAKLLEMDSQASDKISGILAAELNVYLKLIESAVRAEEWDEALNQLALAKAWSQRARFPDDYPGERDDGSSEDVDSGKAAWDRTGEPIFNGLKEIGAMLREQDNLEHVGPIADHIAQIQAEVDCEDWKQALQRTTLAEKYVEDNELLVIVRSEDTPENFPGTDEAMSEREKWLQAELHMPRLRQLFGALLDAEHTHAKYIGDEIEAIDSARRAEEWGEAERRLSGALSFAEAEGLVALLDGGTVEDDDEEVDDNSAPVGEADWEAKRDEYDRLMDLHDRLIAAGHPGAAGLGEQLALIPEAVADSYWFEAMRYLKAAKHIADSQNLWSFDKTLFDRIEEATGKVSGMVSDGIEGAAELLREIAGIPAKAASGDLEGAGAMLEDALQRIRELAGSIDPADVPREGGASEETEVETAGGATASAISGSVGRGGRNGVEDTRTVQRLLNDKGASPRLVDDGDCGPKTIGAIEKFQKAKFGWKDGKVDPDGQTWGALIGPGIVETVTDMAEGAARAASEAVEAASETAEAVVDAVSDAADAATDLIGGLFGGNDDEEEKPREQSS